MERRDFLKYSINLGALALLNFSGIGCGSKSGSENIVLPKLPYAENALEPYISSKTIGFHYGKHHQGYVNKINKLTGGTPFAGLGLEDIIKKTKGQADKMAHLHQNSWFLLELCTVQVQKVPGSPAWQEPQGACRS